MFSLLTFDLGLPLNVKSRQLNFYGLYLLNGACYDQSLHETYIVSHIYGLKVDIMILDLG